MRIGESVIIVTGASAGIGKATAEALATRGANVVMAARRGERLEALVDCLHEHPGRRLALAGDIGEEGFARELVATTVDAFGRVDGLINNAAVGQKGGLVEMPADNMRRLLATNVLGLLYVTQPAAAQMKRQGSGQIVNVSSVASFQPLGDIALYAASKAAVNSISRGLRMELRPYGITVTTVYPGLTRTEFAEARLGQKGASHPFGFLSVGPERVARAIVKAMERKRTEVYVTPFDWFVSQFARHFPRLSDGLISRVRWWR